MLYFPQDICYRRPCLRRPLRNVAGQILITGGDDESSVLGLILVGLSLRPRDAARVALRGIADGAHKSFSSMELRRPNRGHYRAFGTSFGPETKSTTDRPSANKKKRSDNRGTMTGEGLNYP
jgi:hypothetical protein